MRWKCRAEPKEHDRRQVRRFAWLPTRIDDKAVWLERYGVQQRWRVIYSEFGPYGIWEDEQRYTLEDPWA